MVDEIPPEQPQSGLPPRREPVGPPSKNKDDNNMAMLAHLLGVFTCFLGPLIIWLVKKDESQFVDDQGKEALNFQLTVMIAYFVALVPSCFCILFFIVVMGVWVFQLVFGILGAVAASKGEAYRYPLAIRFIN